MLSTTLTIKPIVSVRDDSLALVAKCRTEARVKQHMVDFATKMVRSVSPANRPPMVLLHHSDALYDVHELQAMLAKELPDDTRFRILDLPGSLATHVGQKACAVGMISGGPINSDIMDFEAEMGVTALLHSVEENDVCAVDAEAVNTVGDDSENIDNPGDSAGTDGSVENAGATNPGEPITDQAEIKIVGNPAASHNHSKRIHRTIVANKQGAPLFTTVVSKSPAWGESRQAALDKVEHLVKAISDLALRDKSGPEEAVFGTEGEKSQGSSSSDKRDDDDDGKKK